MKKYEIRRATAEADHGRIEELTTNETAIVGAVFNNLDSIKVVGTFESEEAAKAALAKKSSSAVACKSYPSGWQIDAEIYYLAEVETNEDGDEEEVGDYEIARFDPPIPASWKSDDE